MIVSKETKEYVKRLGLNACFCEPPIEIYFEHGIAHCKKCGGVVC